MKTLRIGLDDLEGVPHASDAARTQVEVSAAYTHDVVLASGRIVPRHIKAKPLPSPSGTVDFEVYESDSPDVAPEARDFAVRVTATIRNTRGDRRVTTVARTVKVLASHTSPVALGSLEPAEGLPHGWVTVAEMQAALDAQTALAQQAAAAAAQAADDAQTALQAQFLTQDEGVAALIETAAGPLTQAALTTRYPDKRQPATTQFGPTLGFAVTEVLKSHYFLGFHPSGDIIASVVTSPGSRTIARSADDGVTWTTIGTPHPTAGILYLWFTAAGSWLAYLNDSIYRSANDGVTWTQVLAPTPGLGSMMEQGWTQSESGTMYIAEYMGNGRVYQSTDDGVTWTPHSDFATTDGSEPGATVRHLHGIASLPSGLWCFSGDNGTQCALWRWETGTWARKTPSESDPLAQRWRSVDLIERDGWLYWVQDGAGGGKSPAMYKAHPSDIGATIQELAQLPSGGFYLTQTPDGVILAGGVLEEMGLELDLACRIWAIDLDDRVHEIFSAERWETGLPGFTTPRGLSVRPSDGRVGFTINNVDFSPGISAASIFGRVTTGGTLTAVSPTTVPAAYDTSTLRNRTVTGSTFSPSTTSTSYVTVPEMSTTIRSRNRPQLVLIRLNVRVSEVGQTAFFDVTRNGATLPNSYFQVTAPHLLWQPVTWFVVNVPLSLADQEISVRWRVDAGGHNASLLWDTHALTVIEL